MKFIFLVVIFSAQPPGEKLREGRPITQIHSIEFDNRKACDQILNLFETFQKQGMDKMTGQLVFTACQAKSAE